MEDIKSPHDLITEETVVLALQQDKGLKARLKSWIIEDFAKKGDNYASTITSVKVFFSIDEINHMVSYIVKLNPFKRGNPMEKFTESIFYKETSFLTVLLPKLNEKLSEAGQVHLRIPKCYYYKLENKKEVVFLEDLRAYGFVMHDRLVAFDVAHTVLILHELARLHASSMLLLQDQTETNQDFDMKEEYPFLKEFFTSEISPKSDFSQIIIDAIEHGGNLAAKFSEYQFIKEWLQKQNIRKILQDQLKPLLPFSSICHGDCWINNVLFRYLYNSVD